MSENNEKPKKRRGWLKGCLTIIGILFVIGVIGAILGGGDDSGEATQVGRVEEEVSEAVETDDQESNEIIEIEETENEASEANNDAQEGNQDSDVAVEEPTPEPVPTDTPQAPTAFEVGDIVSINDYAMVVLGWSRSEGNDLFKPEEGNEFVAVDLLFVNQGSDSESLSSLLQMVIKDSTGQNYQPDLMAQSALNIDSPEGELTAGERVRGTVGFQLPQDSEDLQFVFDASIWGTGKVFVNLGAEPVAFDPPSELAGETAVDAHSIGETISIGDFTLTVNEVSFPEGDDFNKPEDGKQFVVVDVTFENVSGESASLSSLLQMTLRDSTGQKYDVDLMASVASGGSTPDGELVAGEKLRGQVGYQVPVEATDLMFVFDADVFGAGKVFVALE